MIEIAQCNIHVPVLFYLMSVRFICNIEHNSLIHFKEEIFSIYAYNSVSLFLSIHTSFITFVVMNSAVESIIVYCYRIADIVKDTKILETISDYDYQVIIVLELRIWFLALALALIS